MNTLQYEGEQLALEIAAVEHLGFVATLAAAAERLDDLLTFATEWDADVLAARLRVEGEHAQ